MYTNDYMYAIERNDEYLAHFGVKGMRWGVRKARETGNSRRLGRMYQKAAKKLAKLEKRAASGKKYARRAAALGAGAAVAGGAAALGTAGVGNIMRANSALAGHAQKAAGKVVRTAGHIGSRLGIKGATRLSSAGLKMQRSSDLATKAMYKAGRDVTRWGQHHSIGKAAGSKLYKTLGSNDNLNRQLVKSTGTNIAGYEQKLGRISNNAIARIGAGAIGAGLAGAAGYNAYRAATTKRAAKKAAAWKSEMNKAFAGTQYANGGGNRQGKKRKRR